ncbi:MAG: hypothetical protein JSR93_03065 [Verrucomicrobia bacterium]|nr:hypothetical protein [Verrucomicrobiota bacterium]
MNRLLIFFFLFLLPFFVHSESLPNFDKAMGKGTTAWDCIRTPEDRKLLDEFRLHYEKNRNLERTSDIEHIPKVLHWIWLGPRPFPSESLVRMHQWIELHPGWTFKLWTDQPRNALPPEVEISDPLAHLGALTDCYFNSDNFGEKSEVLRLAILHAEGGVYLDHDMEPIRSLDPLVSDFSFFCGLETLMTTLLSSSVYPATNLIASSQNHPILQEAIRWLKSNWDRLEIHFPGSDEAAVENRVKHRGFRALSYGVAIAKNTPCSIVFPSAFFSEPLLEKGIYAAHYHLASWLKKEEEEKVRHAFIEAEEQVGLSTIVTILFGVINLVLGIFLLRKLGFPFRKRAEQ